MRLVRFVVPLVFAAGLAAQATPAAAVGIPVGAQWTGVNTNAVQCPIHTGVITCSVHFHTAGIGIGGGGCVAQVVTVGVPAQACSADLVGSPVGAGATQCDVPVSNANTPPIQTLPCTGTFDGVDPFATFTLGIPGFSDSWNVVLHVHCTPAGGHGDFAGSAVSTINGLPGVLNAQGTFSMAGDCFGHIETGDQLATWSGSVEIAG